MNWEREAPLAFTSHGLGMTGKATMVAPQPCQGLNLEFPCLHLFLLETPYYQTPLPSPMPDTYIHGVFRKFLENVYYGKNYAQIAKIFAPNKCSIFYKVFEDCLISSCDVSFVYMFIYDMYVCVCVSQETQAQAVREERENTNTYFFVRQSQQFRTLDCFCIFSLSQPFHMQLFILMVKNVQWFCYIILISILLFSGDIFF